MLEVWDKYSPSNDVLLGLVKLPLKIFNLSLKGALGMEFGLYPITAFDEYRPINDVR